MVQCNKYSTLTFKYLQRYSFLPKMAKHTIPNYNLTFKFHKHQISLVQQLWLCSSVSVTVPKVKVTAVPVWKEVLTIKKSHTSANQIPFTSALTQQGCHLCCNQHFSMKNVVSNNSNVKATKIRLLDVVHRSFLIKAINYSWKFLTCFKLSISDRAVENLNPVSWLLSSCVTIQYFAFFVINNA